MPDRKSEILPTFGLLIVFYITLDLILFEINKKNERQNKN